MRALVSDAMQSGALGMSTGLAYSFGRAADLNELVSLAMVVAQAGGVYTSHVRNESDTVDEALDEALMIGQSAGCQVHVSHLKALGRANWGKVVGLLERIGAAGATCDVYPYTAASTFLRDAMRAGGTVTPIEPAAISIASAPGVPGVVGKTLDDIARGWKVSPAEAADLLLKRIPSGVSVVYFGMSADDISLVVRDARSVFGSDGLPTLEGAPHPRLFGTFPRGIRRHVMEKEDLSLPEAIRKSTSASAEIFGLRGRGRIEEGAFADVVVFDPACIRDEATFAEPKQYASGIDAVLVNGTLAWEDGAPTGAMRGRVLTRTS
jgi:N-acyl-D-aspartate/D-glutamate deacylase